MSDDNVTSAVSSGFQFITKAIETRGGPADLTYLACEALESAGFVNAFSTRLGGVSSLPSNALNLAVFKGDSKENVRENRRRFLEAIGAEGYSIVTARQTHSVERVAINSCEMAHQQPECDAMISRLEGVLLGVQTADCLPVLIGDPVSRTFAAVHAGWRGTAGRIVERTVADLMLSHGVNTRNCIAALGPAACVECYEVGEDVISRYKSAFGYWRRLFANFKEGGKAHLDIIAANLQQLGFCGFTEDRIHVARYCTMHQNDLFFSYRREGKTSPAGVGRLLSVIGKRDS
jgi:YfiH family protein